MPMNLADYPRAWRKISRTIRRIAGNQCEQCGIANGTPLPSGRAGRVVLTVAHIGAPFANGAPGNKHDKHDVRRENLLALCQRCHLTLDLEDHIAHAKATRTNRKREQAQRAGQLELFTELGGTQHAKS